MLLMSQEIKININISRKNNNTTTIMFGVMGDTSPVVGVTSDLLRDHLQM